MLAIIHNNSEPSFAFMVESFKFESHTDNLEKLKLVKANMNMVIDLADWYSKETQIPFSQMLKVGTSSAIKAIKVYRDYRNGEFDEYLKKEISNALTNFSGSKLL